MPDTDYESDVLTTEPRCQTVSSLTNKSQSLPIYDHLANVKNTLNKHIFK